jgi:HAD superfamily hydrolase (TIGR01484 family)
MTTLPLPSTPSAILSFDFDGTLHHSASVPPVPAEFFAIIRKLREEQGVVWGINTGRAIEHTLEGLLESSFPFFPDWIVAREREIYFPNERGRWLPLTAWNSRCAHEIHTLFAHLRPLLIRIRHEIETHTGAQWMEMDGEPAGVISQSEEEMEWIIDRIEPLVVAEPHLAWQRNSIYLRFGHRDFQKGSSLCEIAKHYGVGAERCFAIGDSHNDFEMLDPSAAGMIACPANAVKAIKDKVRANGGYLAQASSGHGSVEALNHFFIKKT